MDIQWNLDSLYTGYDSQEYINDFSNFKLIVNNFINKYNKLNSNNKMEILESFIIDYKNIITLYRKLSAYSSLSLSTNASDELSDRQLDILSNIFTQLTSPLTEIQLFIKHINNLDKLISSSSLLKEHSFFLNEIKLKSNYMLSKEEEVLISKMKNTGSDSWQNLQNKVISNLLVDININSKSTKMPLSSVRNLAYYNNPNTRKNAYLAELDSYKKIEDTSLACLNGIKGEVITTSSLRGYNSPLHETLFKSRMEKETLDAMFSAIEEYLYIFRKYLKAKANYLNNNNKLPFYDLFAPIGKSNMKFSFDQSHKYIVDNFRSFSDKLADFADFAFKNNWIDANQRPGKRGGAFCSNLHPIGESRILANFDGSFSNTITLAHELGHAYHGHILKDESILNSTYTMPIAETASIFCETIVTNAALNDANDVDKLSILESQVCDYTQTIVDIYSRFLFEDNFFKLRKDSKLSIEKTKKLMIDAQKKAYGNSLDQDILHPYMWINKTHYYSANRSYYNFPYAFGLLFSKGLYSKYLEDKKSFIKKYDDLLAQTGKNSIENIAKYMDIDVSKKEFFISSLELIKKDIELLLSLM